MIPFLTLVYIANIFVAGWISITSLFFPKIAQTVVFENTVQFSETIQLVGALWFAIFLLSVLGLFFPEKMVLVLLFQLVYKSTWLLVVAMPALMSGQDFPKSMALFFVIWVLVLPLVIPWSEIFG